MQAIERYPFGWRILHWTIAVVPSENLIRTESAMGENRIMIFRDENMAPSDVDLVLHSVQVGTATSGRDPRSAPSA